MVAQPMCCNIDDYWNAEQNPDSFELPANFGERFGMSRNRFMQIKQHLRFAQFNENGHVNEVNRRKHLLEEHVTKTIALMLEQ